VSRSDRTYWFNTIADQAALVRTASIVNPKGTDNNRMNPARELRALGLIVRDARAAGVSNRVIASARKPVA
jgi:hypothetical protein